MNLLAIFFVSGLILVLFMENSRLSSRIKDMDWYYTQDREKRLRMESRLEKRISELDSKLRQRIHNEVRKAKKADNMIGTVLKAHEEGNRLAFKAINELQAKERMHVKS